MICRPDSLAVLRGGIVGLEPHSAVWMDIIDELGRQAGTRVSNMRCRAVPVFEHTSKQVSQGGTHARLPRLHTGHDT